MDNLLRKIRSLDRATRLSTLWGIVLAACVVLCVSPSLSLGVGYHVFADQRTLAGIPRTFDVLSNVLFLVVGAWGLLFLWDQRSQSSFLQQRERLPYVCFFAGVMLTGIGSAYYHLQPGDPRLPWDLLPMTVSFMSLLAATIVERISPRAGLALLPVLVLAGLASVVYWRFGELHGHGDYRFYLFTQYFPVVAIGSMVLLFPTRYSRALGLFLAFLFYAAAKLSELCDQQIFSLGSIVSGHTLKHLSAGVACYCILRMLQVRRKSELPAVMAHTLAAASSKSIS